MPRIEKAIESVALTNVAFQLGIAGITSNWTNFIKFHQPFGDRLEQQLKDSEVATWYIVSTSPLGLLDWKSYFIDAVENKKIDIKWVYHPSDILKTSPAIKAQALMLFGYEPDWQVREQTVEMEWGNAVERLKLMVSQSESNIRLGSKTSAGSWELYESTLPHFFFAFLSVPKKKQGLPSDAFVPNGTFGFVHLYPMFPKDYYDRPAIYFEAPGLFTDTYYRSILSMFDEHKNRGYVQRKHPQDKIGAAKA